MCAHALLGASQPSAKRYMDIGAMGWEASSLFFPFVVMELLFISHWSWTIDHPIRNVSLLFFDKFVRVKCTKRCTMTVCADSEEEFRLLESFTEAEQTVRKPGQTKRPRTRSERWHQRTCQARLRPLKLNLVCPWRRWRIMG